MDTEEKAKAYEMALEAARKELGVDRKEWKVVQQVLCNIFHELTESEEDEKMYKMLSSMIHGTFVVETQETQDKLLSWLKSHSSRPKSSDNWKPSEEQMEALEYVIRDYREDCCNATANYLQEVLDHLKNM